MAPTKALPDEMGWAYCRPFEYHEGISLQEAIADQMADALFLIDSALERACLADSNTTVRRLEPRIRHAYEVVNQILREFGN